jgi:hypothetical protein
MDELYREALIRPGTLNIITAHVRLANQQFPRVAIATPGPDG